MKKGLHFIDARLGLLFRIIQTHCAMKTEWLAAWRIFMGTLLLLYFMPSFSWLGTVPQGFFSPPVFSIAGLFESFPGMVFFNILDSIIILSVLCFTIGFYSRVSLLITFLCSCIGYSFAYSFGKIDHGTTLFLFSLVAMAFTNSGRLFALKKDRKLPDSVQRWSLAILAMIIVFGLFTAGLPKLVKWVDLDFTTSGFLSWYYPGYYMYGRQYLLADQAINIPYHLLELADYMAAILEVSAFIFLLLGRKFWRLFLLILCAFHLGNLLLLNIDFSYNFMAYGIFLISPLAMRLASKINRLGIAQLKSLLFLTIPLVVIQHFKIYVLNFIELPRAVYNWRNTLEQFVGIGIWSFALIAGAIYLYKGYYRIKRKAGKEALPALQDPVST